MFWFAYVAFYSHHAVDSLDFEQDTNFSLLRFTHPIAINKAKKEDSYKPFKVDRTASSFRPPTDWQSLFTEDYKYSNEPLAPFLDKAVGVPHHQQGAGTAIQLYASYIIVQLYSGALLIDQQAAHERILYDKFIDHFQNKSGTSQKILMPEHLAVNPTDYMILEENKDILRSLGFIIDPFGKATIIIHGYPAELSNHSPKQLLEGLIEQFKWHNSKHKLETSESLIRALAKKASIPHGTKLNSVEIDALLAQLFSSTNSLYTPDGKKVSIMLSKEILLTFFK